MPDDVCLSVPVLIQDWVALQTTGRIFSVLLVLIWVFGAAFNTSSKGPFSSSCYSANGYFATWVAFFASLMYVYEIYVRPRGSSSDYEQIE